MLSPTSRSWRALGRAGVVASVTVALALVPGLAGGAGQTPLAQKALDAATTRSVSRPAATTRSPRSSATDTRVPAGPVHPDSSRTVASGLQVRSNEATAPLQTAVLGPGGLLVNQVLHQGQSITSSTGGYRLVMQGDGNLVLYAPTGKATWAAGTDPAGTDAVMQGDGNLVVYAATGEPLWSSGTSGHPGAALTLADTGQLSVVAPTGEPLWAGPGELLEDQVLQKNQSITSPTGEERLVMQSTGNLVVYAPTGKATWAAGTDSSGTDAVMQGDGNLVVYAATGTALFASGTSGHPGAYLTLSDTGQLEVVAPTGEPLWLGGPGGAVQGQVLHQGQSITSSTGGYRLVMQGDGNLVLYAPTGKATWAAGTDPAGTDAVMQGDGNLVVYAATGEPLWSSGTSGHPGAALTLADTGQLSVVAPTGEPLWAGPGELLEDQVLQKNQSITSPTGEERLVMQSTGNLVVYAPTGKATWAAGTDSSGTDAVMQGDGNLVVYAATGTALFASGTSGHPGAYLTLSDTGQLEVVAPTGANLWTATPITTTRPSVTAVSPTSGPTTGGTTVTITGTNLATATAVDFGTTRASVTADSSTQIIVSTPAQDPGTVAVSVSTVAGISAASSAARFTYLGTDLCAEPITANVSLPAMPTAYIVDCELAVPAGVTLTVSPGVVVKFDTKTLLSITGTLTAKGTTSAPITFTSVNDDSVGGTTGTGSPKAGDWEGIEVKDKGSVDIEHDKVDYAGYGILAEDPASFTVVDNSAVDDVHPYWLNGTALDLDDIYGNTATGGKPAFYVSGKFASTTMHAQAIPWQTTQLAVPAGVTLTVSPGVVVKFDTKTLLSITGTLTAKGTTSAPITFTSVNDDSVGGTTGTGSPKAGDWEGIEVNDKGSVDIEHDKVDYAGYGILAEDPASFTVVDNSAVDDVHPYWLNGTALDLDDIYGNTATGGKPAFHVSGKFASTTMHAQAIPWQTTQLAVPAGVTLTVSPGVVVKFDTKTLLSITGTLTAKGTTSAPITFTSVNDDSVGGTTGTGSPKAGDWEGIEVNDKGSVDIEHDKVDYAGYGILAEDPASFTVVDNSAVDDVHPYWLNGTALDLDDIYGNTATGGKPAFHVSGKFASTTMHAQAIPWQTTQLAVPAGVTLTVSPGVVVKFDTKTLLSITGTLTAKGTTSAPITFTSVNDDSVGGTTGTGSPKAGDWEGIEVNDKGSVDIEHDKVDYAGYGILAEDPASFTVVDNSAVDDVHPYWLNGTALDLDDIYGNTATGGKPAFHVSGKFASTTMHAQAIPWQTTQLAVPAGVTLTVSPGVVVKFDTKTLLSITGTLTAKGTTSAPITFTSVNDDSVGGTTGTGSPKAGDWEGIEVNDKGSVDIEHDKVDYAGYGILAEDPASFTVVDNSAVDDVHPYWLNGTALDLDDIYGNTATGGKPAFHVSGKFASTTMHAQAIPWQTTQLAVPAGVTLTVSPGVVVKFDTKTLLSITGTLTAKGTTSAPITFTSVNDDSVGGTTGTGSPKAGDWEGIEVNDKGSVDIEHDKVDYAGYGILAEDPASFTVVDNSAVDDVHPYWLNGTALDLDDIYGNTATGGKPAFYVSGKFASTTMHAQAIPWQTTQLAVPAGVTLTVSPGVVVKFDTKTLLSITGTLTAKGTTSAPITFTSVNDDSVGGTTGTGSPKAGDWEGIEVNDKGSVDIEHDKVDYAGTAVSFSGTSGLLQTVVIAHSTDALDVSHGDVSLRGSLETVSSGVQSCNWGTLTCGVDAAYTYWGSDQGPLPTSAAPMVCGQASITPWYSTSARHQQSSSSTAFGSVTCGGGTPLATQLAEASNAYTVRIAQLQITCADGLQTVCQEIQAYEEGMTDAYDIAAGKSPFPLSGPLGTGQDLSEGLAQSEIPVVSTLAEGVNDVFTVYECWETVDAVESAYDS